LERPGNAGAWQFSLPELATAVDAGIGAAIIVWNNSSYGEIKNFMAKEDIPQIGVDLFCPDLVGMARAFGCVAIAPTSVAELSEALRASARRDVPTLIEIKADSAFALSLAS
jgi:acetolactate synthase-1/2/3 large subunit